MKYWLVPLSIAIAIAVLSLMSPPDVQNLNISLNDKLGHFIAYMVLSSCLVWAFFKNSKKKALSFTTLLLIATSSSMYGLLLETLQYTMQSGRIFEIPDLIANFAGSLLGLILYKPIKTHCA